MNNLNLDLLKNGDINKSVLTDLLIYFHEYIENCRNDEITIFDKLLSNKEHFYLKNTQKLFNMIIEIIFNKNKISDSNGKILLDILKYLKEKLYYINDILEIETKQYIYKQKKLDIYRKYIFLTISLIINKLSYSLIKKDTIQHQILNYLKDSFLIIPSEHNLITNNNISEKKKLREIISQLGGNNKKIKISNFKKRLEEMINNNNYGIINIKDYISNLYNQNNNGEIKSLIYFLFKDYLHNNLKKNDAIKENIIPQNNLYLKLKYIEKKMNEIFDNLLIEKNNQNLKLYTRNDQNNLKKLFIELIKCFNKKDESYKKNFLYKIKNIIYLCNFNEKNNSFNKKFSHYNYNIKLLSNFIKDHINNI